MDHNSAPYNRSINKIMERNVKCHKRLWVYLPYHQLVLRQSGTCHMSQSDKWYQSQGHWFNSQLQILELFCLWILSNMNTPLTTSRTLLKITPATYLCIECSYFNWIFKILTWAPVDALRELENLQLVCTIYSSKILK